MVGVAAGGHSKVMIETLRRGGQVEVVGLLDARTELWGSKFADIPVLGGDELLPKLREQGINHAFIGLGGSHDMRPRKRLYLKVRDLGFSIVSVIDPRAIISDSASIGHAPTVLAAAVINCGASISDNVIVNTGSIVEHDCIVGSHVHIATGARLASGVVLEDGVHVGVGAVVRQCIRVHSSSVIGAGAVVVKDVPPGVIVVGVPARILRPVQN